MKRLAIAMVVVGLSAAALCAADPDISKAKCPLSGKPCVAKSATEYNGGTLYFCCTNCPKAFAKDPAKHATKANKQLADTGQAKQTGCPISGKPTKEGTAISVGGVEVAFCCNNCKGKVESAGDDEQLTLCFGADAFEKAFKVGE